MADEESEIFALENTEDATPIDKPSTAKESGQNQVITGNNEEPLWSIEDDLLFQPLGLINHSDDGTDKSVFVTWNEYYLLNFRFKKSKKTKNVEMTKVRIPLPTNGRTYLRSIHMLAFNTILLMSDGHVYCFGSIKSVHNISWLHGIRCFATTDCGFSVIRHDATTGRLLLEVYKDLPSLSKSESTLQSSYDITFDEENLFQCDWQNEKYNLLTITVNAANTEFLQQFFGAVEVGKKVHLFAISGHVYILVPTELPGDCHIELLCVYATPVSFLQILPKLNLCLVYLSCGSVDIWYVSKLLSMKQRQMFYTGAEWIDFDATSDNGDFYYTDGNQLVRLRFTYNADLDECQVKRTVKSIVGMQACTWVRNIEQLVCLSDNNIFYRIAFSLHGNNDEPTDNNAGILGDLSPAAIKRLRTNAEYSRQCEMELQRLRKEIYREHESQVLVAVARNALQRPPELKAILKFIRHLPAFDENSMLLHTTRSQGELHSSGIYALLELKISTCMELLKSTHWQVVNYQGESHVYSHYVPTEMLLNRKCHVVIPLRKLSNELLPEFTIKLVAFVEVRSQISAVILSVNMEETQDTFTGLFSAQLNSFNLFNEPKVSDILAISNNNNHNENNSIITHKLKPPVGTKLNQIAAVCNAIKNPIENDNLELYFVNSKINLSESHDKSGKMIITIRSTDASAIYYFKQQLHLNANQLKSNNADDQLEETETPDDDGALISQQIIKLQCDVERLYGMQAQSLNANERNMALHLETLLEAYERMRNTIY